MRVKSRKKSRFLSDGSQSIASYVSALKQPKRQHIPITMRKTGKTKVNDIPYSRVLLLLRLRTYHTTRKAGRPANTVEGSLKKGGRKTCHRCHSYFFVLPPLSTLTNATFQRYIFPLNLWPYLFRPFDFPLFLCSVGCQKKNIRRYLKISVCALKLMTSFFFVSTSCVWQKLTETRGQISDLSTHT